MSGYEHDRDRGSHHREEILERQHEPREVLEHEARARDVHDEPRDEVEVERRAGAAPEKTERSDAEHRQQDGGDFENHAGERALRAVLKGSTRAPTRAAKVCQNCGTTPIDGSARHARTIPRVLALRGAARARVRVLSLVGVSGPSRSATRSSIRYVALSDGGVAIGLHARPQDGPLLTFVRPQLRDYARALRHAGIEVEQAALADDEFNQLLFADPSGQRIALLEARTFAPAEWSRHNVRACGEFLEYSLPTHSLERSRDFWETLGFKAVGRGETPQPWLRLAGRGLVIGLHQAGFRPGLSFQSRAARRAARIPARPRRRIEGGSAGRRARARVRDAGLSRRQLDLLG